MKSPELKLESFNKEDKCAGRERLISRYIEKIINNNNGLSVEEEEEILKTFR